MLRPALASGDPEASWRLADVLHAEGSVDEAASHLEAARSRFEALLDKHLLAFADHGAEFYIGSGGDPLRALQLAQINLRNRPTLRAFEQTYKIALEAGEADTANEISVKGDQALGKYARVPIVAICARLIGIRERSRRMIVDRRVFVAGAAFAAITPALRVLPADAAVPALNDAIQPVFVISGWSQQDNIDPDNQVWLSIGHGWRTAWR